MFASLIKTAEQEERPVGWMIRKVLEEFISMLGQKSYD